MDERACLLLAPTQAGDISITKPAKPHPSSVPDHGMQQQHQAATDQTEFRLGMAVHRRMWPWDGMKSPLTDVLELDKGRVEVEGGKVTRDESNGRWKCGKGRRVEAVESGKRESVSKSARRRVGFVDSGLQMRPVECEREAAGLKKHTPAGSCISHLHRSFTCVPLEPRCADSDCAGQAGRLIRGPRLMSLHSSRILGDIDVKDE